jgi:HEPN domain-containing protein
VELHYAIEIALKSFSAYDNKKILRTHELFELYEYVDAGLNFDETEIRYLTVATDYHISEAYPVLDKFLPEKEEIESILIFTESLLNRVCKKLKIDMNEIIDSK